MNTLKELLKNNRDKQDIKIYIDNDIIFGVDEHGKFNMDPEDALVEALELLGFRPEFV